jgi:hypothetical protein
VDVEVAVANKQGNANIVVVINGAMIDTTLKCVRGEYSILYRSNPFFVFGIFFS